VRLRRCNLSARANGTIQFLDSDGNALTGPIDVGVRGGFIEPPTREIDQCLPAPRGKGITMRTTAPFNGYVLLSVE